MPRVNTSNSWKKVPINNLYVGLYDGPHATPKPSSNGPIFLGIKNITEDGRLDLSQIRNISEDDFPKWTKRVLPTEGDIVFSYEATLNLYAMIPKGFRGCLGRRLALIRPNTEIVDPKFLYYSFFGEEWRNIISKNLISGATVDRIPLINFPNFEVSIPLLSIQRKIASVLSNYDDLIENNTRRIEILEQMAKLVYEEWFVKFRFPGHEKVKMASSELGEIPEGWKVREVSEILKRLKTGKRYTQDNVLEEGLIPVIDQSEKEVLGFHNDAADHNASLKDPIMIFGDHTCKIKILIEPFSVGPNVVPFISKSYPETFVFFLIKNLVQTKEYKRHWNELQAKKVVLPDVALAKDFVNVVNPLFQQITLLEHKNQNLRKTRDLLLPKLISGEIDVSDLDIRIRNEFQERNFNFGEPQDEKGFRFKMV